jgi:hypothetical protein
MFSNTLSLCSSLNVADQVSQPYKTKGKIIVLYIPILLSLDSRQEDKVLDWMVTAYISDSGQLATYQHNESQPPSQISEESSFILLEILNGLEKHWIQCEPQLHEIYSR